MKAIICTKYGPPEVLQPEEVPKPVPLANEELIRIHDTTCHFGDGRVLGAILPLWMQLPFSLYMGIQKPRCGLMGMELSGVVVAAG
jgi:NADPH:quinone reductase-like Zn-dependent oxidoreductase